LTNKNYISFSGDFNYRTKGSAPFDAFANQLQTIPYNNCVDACSAPTTTSTSTTAAPTTTTTTSTSAPTTTSTTSSTTSSTSTSTSTSSTSTSTSSTSTSTSTSSSTTTTTTTACIKLTYGVDWTITGSQSVAQNSVVPYTITAIATDLSKYPITGVLLLQGGYATPSGTYFLNAPGDTHNFNVTWFSICSYSPGYVVPGLFNTCTPNVPENYYYYPVSGQCGTTTTTTTNGGGGGTTTSTTSSTTSTTTTQLATVSLDPRNSLNTGSYTPYINGIADPAWDSGNRNYPLGTTIRLDYSSPACNVTLNGSSYSSGTTITLSSPGTSTFTLLNADNWINNGGTYCSGNELRQPIINDCGATSYNVISYCSCQCNAACNGTYWGAWYCDGNVTKRNQYYYCNNAFTGVTETNPNCTVACTGTYWAETCSGTTLTRTEKYSCNGANTGNTQTITCSSTCGASTTQVWSNTGDPYCITGSCTLRQLQTQTNPCASGYGTTRVIDTGTVSESCGSWDLQYYCVGYNLWSQEVNYCTSATRNQQLVQVNSPTCGYVPPSYDPFYISTVGTPVNVCTRAVDQLAYCTGGVPSIGKTIYTDSIGSSTLGSGYYNTDNGYIQLNSGGTVISDGIC
jgi:hypothetical protein